MTVRWRTYIDRTMTVLVELDNYPTEPAETRHPIMIRAVDELSPYLFPTLNTPVQRNERACPVQNISTSSITVHVHIDLPPIPANDIGHASSRNVALVISLSWVRTCVRKDCRCPGANSPVFCIISQCHTVSCHRA